MANTSNLDLVKPAGTDHALISVINSNMDKVDAYAGKVNNSLAGVEDGLAIVATGNTHAAITAGQFVYVKEHNTLPEGLYTASSNIAANATLSTTNLTADSKGGLNALSEQIGNLSSLATDNKSSVVSSVNEVYTRTSSIFAYKGLMGDTAYPSKDFNDYKASGLYYNGGTNAGFVNAPSNADYGTLIVQGSRSSVQIWIGGYAGNFKIRKYDAGSSTWSAWKDLFS